MPLSSDSDDDQTTAVEEAGREEVCVRDEGRGETRRDVPLALISNAHTRAHHGVGLVGLVD